MSTRNLRKYQNRPSPSAPPTMRLVLITVFFFGFIGFMFQFKQVGREKHPVPLEMRDSVEWKQPAEKEHFTGMFFIPEAGTNEVLVCHPYFAYAFDTLLGLPSWVAYELAVEQLSADAAFQECADRVPDSLLMGREKKPEVPPEKYLMEALLPASDFSFDQTVADQTCLTSLLTPQMPAFFSGVWSKAGKKVREWATANRHLYVVSGVVMDESSDPDALDIPPIPQAFYKVILDFTDPEVKSIAFYFPHVAGEKPLESYGLSVRSLEKQLDMVFFPSLFAGVEGEKIKSRFEPEKWFFNSKRN